MNNSIIQLLVLAGIAVFLILKLRSVLGTRDGFEKPPTPREGEGAAAEAARPRKFEVIEGSVDYDIQNHVAPDSPTGQALAAMKRAEPSFNVSEFLGGARGAYEMIVMGFERGTLEDIRPFLAPEVYETFAEVVAAREAQGLTVEANFIGISELALHEATFDARSKEGEVSVRFISELTTVVRNSAGEIVEGSAIAVKRQRDVWTFSRQMGSADPNWVLVATGE